MSAGRRRRRTRTRRRRAAAAPGAGLRRICVRRPPLAADRVSGGRPGTRSRSPHGPSRGRRDPSGCSGPRARSPRRGGPRFPAMPPPRRLARRSFLDTRDVRAFFEGSAFGGSASPDARRSETASRHALTVVAAAVSALDRGEDALDLSEAAVPDLPSHARRGLHDAGFELLTSAVASEATSADGSTTKLVVRLQDGHEIETVLMRHDGGRNTLCVSSQIGRKMAHLLRHGTPGARQPDRGGDPRAARRHIAAASPRRTRTRTRTRATTPPPPPSVTNVAFMGMGEPLNNYLSSRRSAR